MTYSEKLKDPRWQKKRLEVMNYADFRCQICGAKDRTLHVHHSYYTRGKEPWQYPSGSLICICEGCHGKLHPEKATPPPPQPGPLNPAGMALIPAAEAASRFAQVRAILEGAENGR